MTTRTFAGKASVYALLAAGTVVFLFPLWWMVAVSLKTADAAQEVMSVPMYPELTDLQVERICAGLRGLKG